MCVSKAVKSILVNVAFFHGRREKNISITAKQQTMDS